MKPTSTKKAVYALATNIVSTLGLDTKDHWDATMNNKIGIQQYEDASLSTTPFYASKISSTQWQTIQERTKTPFVISPFEQMAIFSARQALSKLNNALDLDKTVLILSTTKGNIEWLEQAPDDRILLTTSAAIIANTLGIKNQPVVISHACVSGVIATMYAQRLLSANQYKHAIVVGADRMTKFVLSGFQSFQAIADEPCKPFDKNRKGINLGEAAATIILSTETSNEPLAQLVSGSTSNDANHISGPSRTGEELALAINRALTEAAIDNTSINMISAHGTATLYNDEMESKAFGLANMSNIPTHSFKGFIGHTLGAAGVAESAMIIKSIQQQCLIPSAGFQEIGVPIPLNITQSPAQAEINYVLKTASGFGGCNAVTIWRK